jgi:hypothetical protein
MGCSVAGGGAVQSILRRASGGGGQAHATSAAARFVSCIAVRAWRGGGVGALRFADCKG